MFGKFELTPLLLPPLHPLPPSPNTPHPRAPTRKHDYASHLTTALMHPLARDAHLAIRAFNIDTALIDDAVTSVAVGRMRMQYWRDAVDATFSGRAPAEPVAVLLGSVLRGGAPLGKGWFRKVIGCREQYLGAVPFATLEDLEAYAEGTYGSLNYLSLESFGVQSVALDHVASHIGKAVGIAAILRGMPLLAFPTGAGAGAGAVVFPLDVCAQHGLRQEDVLRKGSGAEGLRDAVFAVATRANDHLITARKMLGDYAGAEGKGAPFGAFLSAVPTALYLERLEKVDFDPFDQSLQKRPWKLPWRAYRAYSTKKF
ncbi:hypothetical protein P167DRAFT_557138 [Morchella conica CCBAS932]|uniref:Squalene/phytoene synthase n=1 Tax=Morchella conica CCBAS932 TaxID=1392247 RepID=A0A3N4L2H3_9PEZI|nr:hypothetical protein P167DRAFT_557138 [Morchella conica CCBAS932]